MKENHIIVGIHIHNRISNAADVQQVLTDYGCSIKTRLGLHEVAGDFCAASGIILLEMIGAPPKTAEMMSALNRISGVDAQQMVFEHDD